MLSFKLGVKLLGLQPQMLIALRVVQEEFSRYGLDTVVTSGNDSTHMSGSLHYKGAALDFRTKHAAGIATGIVQGIKKTLAPLGFDVVFEAVGKDNEHCHVEYQAK